MAKAKRQQQIPGMERETHKEVNHAAEAYVDARDTRMKHTEKEVEARDALVAVMEKHELSVYRDDESEPPLIITLTPGKAKVKVTQADEDEAEAEGVED